MDNNNKWDALSLTEKSEVMKQAVANGITDLNEIRQTYNEYADGGSMDNTVGEYADAIYQNATEEPYGDPSSHYNNVDEELLRTLKPDYRGHYSDDVKLPNHPSSPVRGRFNGRYFDLTDKGMENPNYTLFGLIDNGDGNTTMRYDGADVLPEITVTPQGNYYDDTYNNIRIKQSNTFKGGGYIPSASIKRDIANFEGSSMKTNRSFEAEAKDFNRVIPQAIRNKLSQRQLDALYSYGYNVGMGNLKSRVLPTLTAYTQGRAGANDVAASMWASKDPYMRGLQRRRAYERNMFTGNSPVGTQESIVNRAINMDLSNLPTVAQFTGETPKFQYDLFPPNPTNYGTPIDWSTPEKKVETPTITPKEDNSLGLFALINQTYDTPKQEPLISQAPQRNNSMFVVSAPTSNDTFLDSSWFKKGGYLYKDGGDVINHEFTYDNTVDYKGDKYPTSNMLVDGINRQVFADSDGGVWTIINNTPTRVNFQHSLPEIVVKPHITDLMQKQIDDYLTTSNDATVVGNPSNAHLKDRGIYGAMAHAAWEKEHPYLSKASLAASAVPFAVAAYPFVAGAGEAAYPLVESVMQSSLFPYVDAGLTALGGADAANDIYNGNANTMTALEIAPMAQMFKPLTYTVKNAANAAWHSSYAQYPRYYLGKLYYGRDTELPTLYRKMYDIPQVNDGKMQISPVYNRFAYLNGEESPLITNMTTDVPVRSHSTSWAKADVLAFPGKTLLGKHVISTRPSDTFTFGDVITANPKKVTYISGRPKALKVAEQRGMKTLSSEQAEDVIRNHAFGSNNNYRDYEVALQNITRHNFKSPTLKDYKFMDFVFQPKYKSRVIHFEDLSNPSINQLNNSPEWIGDLLGNQLYRMYLSNPKEWRNVLYHPASSVEYQFRKTKGIELKDEIPGYNGK